MRLNLSDLKSYIVILTQGKPISAIKDVRELEGDLDDGVYGLWSDSMKSVVAVVFDRGLWNNADARAWYREATDPVQAYEYDSIGLGGPGSGNWAHLGGHKGPEGKLLRGGSRPRDAGMTIAKGKDWLQRYTKASGREHPFEKVMRKQQAEEKAKRANTLKARPATHAAGVARATDPNSPENRLLLSEIREGKGAGTHPTLQTLDDYAVRGSVKDDIVTTLAGMTGESYEICNAVVKQWSYSSNDSDYRSLSVQKTVAEIMGVPLSPWQKEKLASYVTQEEYNKLPYSQRAGKQVINSVPEASQTLYGKHPDPAGALKRVLKGMYDLTQHRLQEAGLTEVQLYRGFDRTGSQVQSFKKGTTVRPVGNALESWASDVRQAERYGQVIFSVTVPASRIFCTTRTGFGCLYETEFVVLSGGDGDTAYVLKGS